MNQDDRTYSQAEREEIESIAAAYVLGVIDTDGPEMRRFDALFEAGDPLLVSLLEAFYESTGTIAEAAEQHDAPEELKAAILTKIKRLEQEGSTDRMVKYDPNKPAIPASTYRSIRRKNRALISIGVLGGLLMCVLIAMNVVKSAKLDRSNGLMRTLLKKNDSLLLANRVYAANDSITRCVLRMLQEENARLVTMTTPQHPEHQHLFFSPKQRMVVVMRENLPPTDSMHCYEVWAIVGKSAPKPVGHFTVSSKDTEPMYTMGTDLAYADAFAISEEPRGGSAVPSGEILYSGNVPRYGRN